MKTDAIFIITIIITLLCGCGKDDSGTTPTPVKQEDWTFPVNATRDSVTLYCEKQSVAVGESFEVKIVLYNVSEIFGCAVEVQYASDKCEVTSGLAGTLFPADSIIALPPKIESASNRVSYSVTKQRGTKSLSGSGIVFKMKCKAKTAGNASFTINTATLEIRKADGLLVVRPVSNLSITVR